ncbi:GNAT family N-acetyltransferase [Leifsonia shinshuensis]|uniref:GNAT superfamily N-acetyltransferase n=1 Tax=Leifsonia shinshuensis TaxID=150026 RepID=A0A853CXV8_9MICO|nr:GNAT family N-acetyltransferase [Leifsonia shinshuensis]NYJ23630.1 GNAT superfamily N-acetyltransferase [Leifsonia shinshuensis]
MAGFRIRQAAAEDARILADMLVEAANWNALRARPRVAVLEDPKVLRYVAGWKRPGDFGCVAEDTHGAPVGACWARLFPADEPGSGFVAVGVPELTLGVNTQWRAQGVGRALLQELGRLAAGSGANRLSLSVERANFAQRLYVSEGYITVESRATADTMVRAVR